MKRKLNIRNFLLKEEKVYLGNKVGDILTSLQELNKDAPNMGKRHLMRLIKNIVRQIRRILNSNWNFEDQYYLKILQKVGVALMKALDTNDDLPTIISSATDEVEKLSEKIDEPINDLASPADNRDNEES